MSCEEAEFWWEIASDRRLMTHDCKILNKALKTCRPLIALWLADIAKVYFIIGYYLRLKRAIIMVVLYKEGKADYLILGNY